MKRPARPEDLRLWAKVAETVTPRPGRVVPKVEEAPAPAAVKPAAPAVMAEVPHVRRRSGPKPPPDLIEPRRHRRLVRERDVIEARIDLHGMTWDAARAALESFLHRAAVQGHRAVLVITGKGRLGDGILRRSVPDWLNAPGLRELVAGVSPAARRHGGEGALYVALKRVEER
ncbi:DNA-nicking Smr family endonuclease [Caulobacter ginsengisoli]|uniref:DNA-nicking Smr family endonuclease n=1 Tax=Caulobacter ginsengisoli TaxID=400775 RepID=A0ABU0ITD1_9CAUL|nr:Smr/MutS family protein [Caulobacter ginsengisoli]MDQ0465261.1 DNA-nicking Smr family endonuclease [Caulobacter ginsengisoli]